MLRAPRRRQARLAAVWALLYASSTLGAAPAPTPKASDIGWAWPSPPAQPAAPAPARSMLEPVTVPGARRVLTLGETRNLFRAVDWFPERHAPAPPPVLVGHAPDAMACGFCHLPDGQGRPENAGLAGLPAAYIERQVAAFASGDRSGVFPDWRPTALMTRVAKGWTPDAVADAAQYFSRLKYVKAFRLVEAGRIARLAPAGGVYRLDPAGTTEPLGQRILERPNDDERFELRDNRPGYTAYAPLGSVARGRRLAVRGDSAAGIPACSTCHGPRLRGQIGPPLAGRYPVYLFRQLQGFARGARNGDEAKVMAAVAAKMTDSQMIDSAAYAASLQP